MTKLKDLSKSLSNIKGSNDSPDVGTDEYKKEYEAELLREELKEKKLRNEALAEENMGDAQDRDQRKDFADRIYFFVYVYMIFVFLILFLSGSKNSGFHLNDSVLSILLKTTTANVIGILAIVITYLFSRKKK
ncbi:hypothetical protein HMPREF0103_0060 [Bacteroides sp. 2_1_33B]|nr:hypothetical protein HMPREF0103_0060 [Bacteroides sp. 2_1_33B]